MNNRIFLIGKNCYIIYTGQSSTDTRSFLRIGATELLSPEVQRHIRYIVVPDATRVDTKLEKENITHMQTGKIRYICNKENQDLLFSSLEEAGVDTKSLYHKDLSKDIDNIMKVENKKHFFTIFYDNKNVKVAFNEEIIFDYFNFEKDNRRDYEKEKERLLSLISRLDSINAVNRGKAVLKDFKEENRADIDCRKTSLFLLQDNIYIPLSIGMFKVIAGGEGEFELLLNCSSRFYVGKEITLTVLENGDKRENAKGFIYEGEVVESEILYQYKISFSAGNESVLNKVLTLYQYFIERPAK